MEKQILYSNLSDKYDRLAQKAVEPAPEKRRPAEPLREGPRIAVRPPPAPGPTLPKVTPDEINKLVASGAISKPGVARPVEKNGTPLATEGAQRSQWMDITPELARRWLQNNFRNRPISEDLISAYARDMASGAWVATHQGIAFNDRDELIDGQHRLHAVIACARTIRMMVTFGLPSEIEGSLMTVMDAVDRGRTRSVADQLKIQHGMRDGSIIAAVCATLGTLCFGERTKRLSVGQTLEIYGEFELSVKFVISHRSKSHGLKSAGVLAAFAFAHAVEPRAKEWFLQVTGEQDITEQNPLRLLREFLVSDDARLLNRGTDRGLSELVLQALWLHDSAKKVEVLAFGEEGPAFYKELQKERVAKIAAIFRLPK